MLKQLSQDFWGWYERNYGLNIGISAILFSLQLIHLFWLTTDVVALRLLGESLFNPSGIAELIIVLVDYLEVPTLLSVSLIYINELRVKWNTKSVIYLVFLNSQWLHILWITDEIVITMFTGAKPLSILPLTVVWIAILIDYLELPVIFDTLQRFYRTVRQRYLTEKLDQ